MGLTLFISGSQPVVYEIYGQNLGQVLAKLITEFVEGNPTFQGNTSPFDTSKDLHNWNEVFPYILTD